MYPLHITVWRIIQTNKNPEYYGTLAIPYQPSSPVRPHHKQIRQHFPELNQLKFTKYTTKENQVHCERVSKNTGPLMLYHGTGMHCVCKQTYGHHHIAAWNTDLSSLAWETSVPSLPGCSIDTHSLKIHSYLMCYEGRVLE